MDPFWEACDTQDDPEKTGEAIAFAIPEEDGSLRVDLDALGSILNNEDIKNLPVSVVSIAGDFRTGKSFLLNIFLRRLNSVNKNGEIDDRWLLDATGPMNSGFHWRGGAELATEGILMWNKPFILRKRDKKVAVLLIDTQGNFDHKSKRENNYKIFALSTLMSSAQIYNVSRQLQDNTFEHLQAFLTYAKACESENESPFQSLFFVIRDWSMPYQYQFGKEGGDRYLDHSCSKSLVELDKKSGASIKGSFQRINCYLMPFPGSAVNTCPRSSDLQMEDIDREFVRHAQILTDETFDCEDLIVKEIGGHVVHAGTLYDFVKKWKELLESESLPDIRTVTEFIIEHHCSTQMEASVQKFEEFFLLVKEKKTFVAWNLFDQMVKDGCNKSTKQFLDSTPFGRNTPVHNRYFERVRVRLNEKREEMIRMNGENRFSEIEKECNKLVMEHRDVLNAVSSWFTYGKQLSKAHGSILAKLRSLKAEPTEPRDPRGISLVLDTAKAKLNARFEHLKKERNEDLKDTALTGAAAVGSACALTGLILIVGPELFIAGTVVLAAGAITGQVSLITLVVRRFRLVFTGGR